VNIKFEENKLTAKHFIMLRESVGLEGAELQIVKALQSGLYNVIAKDGDKVAGMGRIAGDSIMHCYVQDVIVDPQYQGNGIEKEILQLLTQYVENDLL